MFSEHAYRKAEDAFPTEQTRKALVYNVYTREPLTEQKRKALVYNVPRT